MLKVVNRNDRRKMSWGVVTEGGSTTHDVAMLSAPLKLPGLLICISKHTATSFKVLIPMRPDWGRDLCLSVGAGGCGRACICL